VDIVTQVSPTDAERVISSSYAKLVTEDTTQVLAGIFNGFTSDISFSDWRLRIALNLAVDRQQVINQGFHGYANSVPALTPPWALDFPEDLSPRPHDPERAQELFSQVGWPQGRPLRLAAPKKYENVAVLIARNIEEVLKIDVEVMVVPEKEKIVWMRVLAEKKLVPNWDILLMDSFALFSEATPAFIHREFFGFDGSLRAGPEIEQFDQLYSYMAAQTNQKKLLMAAKQIDRYVFDEALALFLCAPQTLYAVNKHVNFRPYRTTFELADTEVDAQHWSRQTDGIFNADKPDSKTFFERITHL
jgi:peptide/nickel transport system substrate-binding protein